MRISNSMNYNQVKSSIGKNRQEMFDLQNQAATMKRITKPSDDAVGTTRLLSVRTEKTNNEQFLKNLEMAKTYLNFTESALGSLSEIVMKAKELAIGQASEASANASTRMAVATEVEQMYQDLVNIGNRKFGERYIFGGFKTTTNPFDEEGFYKGDDGQIQLEISKGTFATVNVPGDKILGGRDSAMSQIPADRRGANSPNYPVPERKKNEQIDIRSPSSLEAQKENEANKPSDTDVMNQTGEDVFAVFRSLITGLRANDTVAIQDNLESLDSALDQVVMYRSEVGSRIASLDNTSQGLQRDKIDQSSLMSSIEDADPFEVFTDITKNENVLKATMQTSGKLIQPSLLDFLR